LEFSKLCWNTGEILKIFEGEKIYIHPAIQFEDLHRELLSIKYTYINKWRFSEFYRQTPFRYYINDSDIKDYLLYLAEEKQSATSTLNQAINALKFYYGMMLRKKFVYEVKRPKKDKKLPVVLSKEEIEKSLIQ